MFLLRKVYGKYLRERQPKLFLTKHYVGSNQRISFYTNIQISHNPMVDLVIMLMSSNILGPTVST